MQDEPSLRSGRRRILTTVAACTGVTRLAECSSLVGDGGGGNSGAADVVYNLAPTPKTVSITVTDTGAESPHTSRTLDLAPGDVVNPVNDSKLPTNTSEYVVEVAVEDGPSETFEWTDPTVTLAQLWVQIADSQNFRFLLQAG
jgi:hypothetical protein